VRHGAQTPYALPDADGPQVQSLEWDTDARDEAWEESRRLAERDPEAAALLVAHLHAATAPAPDPDALDQTPVPTSEPFDPMVMFAELAAFYHWTDASMRQMPWKRLLAYYREAVRMKERDEARMRTSSAPQTVSQEEFMRNLRRMTTYEGDVVPVS